MSVQSTLQRAFGLSDFRPGQREAIEAVLAGKDVFCLFPTGSGKSLTFQLPAVHVNSGFGIVIEPIIALMEDQLKFLKSIDVSAALLNSSVSESNRLTILASLSSTSNPPPFKLLYLTPEQLTIPTVRAALATAKSHVLYLAVDEAHCISDWGHDFRPAYAQIGSIRTVLAGIPIIACTATATTNVVSDIFRQLKLKNPLRLASSFDRPNLIYTVLFKSSESDEALQIAGLIKSRWKCACGIIYCWKRQDCDRLADSLGQHSIQAAPFHAELANATKSSNQTAWMSGEVQVLCATVAFGMGINKPNVRFVMHTTIPKNLAGYYQESGRAGRDGKQAHCVLFYSEEDRRILEALQDTEKKKQGILKVANYCLTGECRRVQLLRFFGEGYTRPSDQKVCCDFCAAPDVVRRRNLEFRENLGKKGGFKDDTDLEVGGGGFKYEFDSRSKTGEDFACDAELSRSGKPEDDEELKTKKGSA